MTTSTTFDTLRYDVSAAGVATIALDQPNTRNALSDPLIRDLLGALAAAKADEAVRCVVLPSTHETTFSAGGNLGGMAAEVPLVHKHFANARLPAIFRALGELGKPTICAANGHVLAGAWHRPRLRPHRREGVRHVRDAGDQRRRVPLHDHGADLPQRRAQEDQRTAAAGRPHRRARGGAPGIVNRVVAAEDFDAAVTEWAERLAKKSPLLMRMGKDAMFLQQDMPPAEALDYLRAQLTLATSTEDIREGVAAFFEKREPVWSGR